MVSINKRDSFTVRVRRAALILARNGATALEPLFDLTAERLLRYALTLTRNHEDAEDALQAAMIRITLKPQVLSQAKYPWAYCLRIVRNESITVIRRRKPQQRLHPAIVPTTSPDWRTEEQEMSEQVRQAVQKLPPAQAEVVALKVWEEMTFQEIAAVLGESPNTVASRYRYALEKLTRLLHQYEFERTARD